MSKAIFPALGAMMAAVLLAVPQNADAALMWTFGPGDEFSGTGETLSGEVAVTIDGSGGSVDVTIDATALSGTEKISQLYLNLDPALDPTTLNVTIADNTDPKIGSIGLGADAFKADGDGLYDIVIDWTTSDPGIFGAGDTDLINFTLGGLTFEDFDFLSTPAGGHGPFLAAMHVLGLGDNSEGSGWYAATDNNGGFDPGDDPVVPEPGTLALLGFGLMGLGLAVRRRRKTF